MIKVLIADDEPRIRRGIKSTINWEENDFELVGEAEDGEEALSLIKEKTPDILFIDSASCDIFYVLGVGRYIFL